MPDTALSAHPFGNTRGDRKNLFVDVHEEGVGRG